MAGMGLRDRQMQGSQEMTLLCLRISKDPVKPLLCWAGRDPCEATAGPAGIPVKSLLGWPGSP